jgi:geranylgeranyl reductase
VFFDPRLTDFYCWTIPKEDRMIVGGAFHPRRRASERFDELKDALARCGYRFGRRTRREGALLLRPAGPRQIHAGAGGVLLAGEAAGFISPSSAEGLSYAMRSALHLAAALREGTEHAASRYAASAVRLAGNIFLKNLKSQVIFRPSLRMLVMRSGLRSEEIS